MIGAKLIDELVQEWSNLSNTVKTLEQLLTKLTLRVDQIQVEKPIFKIQVEKYFEPNSITNTVNCPKPRRWIFEETGEYRVPTSTDYYLNQDSIEKGIKNLISDYPILRLVEKPE
jgi:hypothetical protein